MTHRFPTPSSSSARIPLHWRALSDLRASGCARILLLCTTMLGSPALPLEATAPPGRISNSILQIGIVPRATQVVLRPEGKFSVVDQKTGQSYPLEDSQEYTVHMNGQEGIFLGHLQFQGQIRLLPSGPTDFVRVGRKRYRGNLLVKPNPDDTFSVVSEMGLEEYLFGVLPAEMSEDWPLEALKAQAVVARTFALNNLGKYQSRGYDLSDDSSSQVYADVDRQSVRAVRAVRETEGEVLAWHGQILTTFFHSCCGGKTTSHESIWGDGDRLPRPLSGVSDRYCRASPQFQWTAHFEGSDILAALLRHGYPASRIRNIRPGRRDGSGFLRTIRLSTDAGPLEIRANEFREWLGPNDLKSTKIYRILQHGDRFLFAGRGFGHGVGLCQWGAYYMAIRGKGYREILKHYFPGVELAQHDE